MRFTWRASVRTSPRTLNLHIARAVHEGESEDFAAAHESPATSAAAGTLSNLSRCLQRHPETRFYQGSRGAQPDTRDESERIGTQSGVLYETQRP